MSIIYHESDGNLDDLTMKTIGVIGYGHLGRPTSLNLRDAGVPVLVGGDDAERETATSDGFDCDSVAAVVRRADVLLLAIPDEAMTDLYLAHVSPHLSRGDTLVFGSAYNLAFGFIEPPPFVDVGLIAPRTFDGAPRPRFSAEGGGFYSFVAVGQDASGNALNTVLGLALALGALRNGAAEVSMEQEAEITLFVQQALIPAYYHMMLTAAQLMLREGYPPDAALPDLYLGGKFGDYVERSATSGLLEVMQKTSQTGQYSSVSRFDRFNALKLERLMEITLEEIRSGDFTQEWAREFTDGAPRLKALLKQQAALDLWDMEQQTLDMMPR